MPTQNITFSNKNNFKLVGKIEWPATHKPRAFAVFAHVFTGNKNIAATRNIARALTLHGIAVLRFDFTGLGESEGAFKDSSFTSNVEDLVSACDYLAAHYEAPKLIVGHSLGGAASIFAASKVDSIQAVATIGAPSEPKHVRHLLKSKIEDILKDGSAVVEIGGQEFVIKKEFLDDLENNTMESLLPHLRKAILVLHSPQDTIVEIENAAHIYAKAFHPKSFVTLNGADHMLTNKDDAYYTGSVIASWAMRYIDQTVGDSDATVDQQSVFATIEPLTQTTSLIAGRHGFIADTSESSGGQDFGPSPYQLLLSALASSTSMHLKAYADHQGISYGEINVKVTMDQQYNTVCGHVNEDFVPLSILRHISISVVDEEQLSQILAAASYCPVYRQLSANTKIVDVVA